MKNTMRLLMISLSLACMPVSLYAKTYTVGVENLDYPPFSTYDGKVYNGFFKDLLMEFGKASGDTFVIKPQPVKRLMNNLITKQIDFKIPDNKYWASSLKTGHNIKYSDFVTVYTDGIMVIPSNKGKGYGKLVSMATVRGFTPFPFLDDIAKGTIKLSENTTLEQVLKMVKTGRVYGGFANVTVANRYMDQVMKNPSYVVFDDKLPAAVSDISLSTIQYPEVIDKFNAWLIKNAGWFNKLKMKYGVP